MSAVVNKEITGTYDHVGDAVIYGDTDSVYFSAYPMLKHDIQNGDVRSILLIEDSPRLYSILLPQQCLEISL